MNPIEQTKYIEEQFRKYIKSTFELKDPMYNKIFLEELNSSKLVKGPYIIPSLPFKLSKSINELIKEKKASILWKELYNVDLDRKLYIHQCISFEKISNGRNAVITTGTGSGKTESFLYPIINDLLNDIENGREIKGIRAIFLFPMNALVNDQIERLRAILSVYPKITYGYYTGDTKEKTEQAKKDFIDINVPSNEIISREEIRENPPNLLFTNYSMLEYLLIRPKDSFLFDNKYSKNLKFIVLDEAHTYSGALGIELSYLLKRTIGMLERKPQFILTSATLGKGKEDINEIIEFAKNLTSVNYTFNDIIFGIREALDPLNIEYYLSSEDLKYAYENKDDLEKLYKKFYKIVNKSNIKDSSEYLYELLIKDSNIYLLYKILNNNGIKTFYDALDEFKNKTKFNKDDLIILIKLLNIAKKNNRPIYENKYHTFIKTLSGAFVTIGEDKNLKINNFLKINDKQAFEIGVCKHCNQMFIIGKTVNNYLLQNQNIDIDENYDEFENAEVEYYILKDDIDIEDYDEDILEEYIICSRCGKINNNNNIYKDECDCDEKYKVDVYKILTNNSKMKNNLSTCPCCKNVSTIGGIVIGFHIGKDRATALIAQILYETLYSDNNNESSKIKWSLFGDEPKEQQKNKKVKQFLAFSDSRQQASYFATFYNYNYKRFLRKRIIWEALQDNNKSISVSTLVNSLIKIIEDNTLFDDKYPTEVEAWITILNELLLVDGNNSAEGLGLFAFKLNDKEIKKAIERFSEEDINKFLNMYNISNADLYNLINILLEIFRTSSSIDYTKVPIDTNIREDELGYRSSSNYIVLKKEKSSNEDYGNIRSFLPVNEHATNKSIEYLQKILNINKFKIIEFLGYIFRIVKSTLLTEFDLQTGVAYKIDPTKYILESYKNLKFYKCDKCKKLTLYNVKNICPTKNCNGILHLCNVDKEKNLIDNYYRNEYINKKIERMIIKEHTAQLGKKTAKEYQRKFKDKEINILSCSTTFEMGVDIGSLENVFLRNVPPSPSNYVQRAGRAGRGKDSSAFILTFCSNSSHDYNYFCDPTKMILGIVEPPKFKVNNEKIIIRHLTAASLGFFFKLYPNFYKNIKAFVFDGGIELFKEYLNGKPKNLNDYINIILNEDIRYMYNDFIWVNKIFDNESDLIKFKDYIISSVIEFQDDLKSDLSKDNYEYYKGQIDKIYNGKIIDNLSRYNVIPKYGFPVDVVDLIVYDNNGKKNTKYEMSRDLSISISEYAPESEVIVDEKKYTSRYLVNYKRDSDLTKYYYFQCENDRCQKVNISFNNLNDKICRYCGQPFIGENRYFIEPIYGFATDRKNVTSRNIKPKKTYSSEIKYVGNGEASDEIKDIKGIIKLEPLKDDELIILNENPFYRCLKCGYSKIDRNNLEYITIEHNDKKGYKCDNKVLEKYSLGHKFKTDVIKIQIKNRLANRYEALSTLYALLEGISLSFNIDRNDIDGLILPKEDGVWQLVIFDNVPGGAGYVKNLLDENKMIKAFEKALDKVSQECCDENTSCYNCLRNYKNQRFHRFLKRRYAKQLLTEVIKELRE